MSQIVSSDHSRRRLQTDFGMHGGPARLARLLGVTSTSAIAMVQGAADASLAKPAALYGYEPSDLRDEWIKSDVKLDPKRAGYRRWTNDEVTELCRRLRTARSTAAVARAMGVTPGAVHRILARRQISIRSLRAEA